MRFPEREVAGFRGCRGLEQGETWSPMESLQRKFQ